MTPDDLHPRLLHIRDLMLTGSDSARCLDCGAPGYARCGHPYAPRPLHDAMDDALLALESLIVTVHNARTSPHPPSSDQDTSHATR